MNPARLSVLVRTPFGSYSYEFAEIQPAAALMDLVMHEQLHGHCLCRGVFRENGGLRGFASGVSGPDFEGRKAA